MQARLDQIEAQREKLQSAVNDLAKSEMPWSQVERTAEQIRVDLKGAFDVIEVSPYWGCI
jgi:hypothetical protein